MRFADLDIRVVGILLALTLALAGYALGGAAAEAAGEAAHGHVQWADLDPRAWFSFSGMVVAPPADAAG